MIEYNSHQKYCEDSNCPWIQQEVKANAIFRRVIYAFTGVLLLISSIGFKQMDAIPVQIALLQNNQKTIIEEQIKNRKLYYAILDIFKKYKFDVDAQLSIIEKNKNGG